jgi:probable F420-dependent oxidoreductase
VKLGVNILNFGVDATPDALRTAVRLAEDEGYDFVMISDHVALTPDVAASYPAPFYDPLVCLAYLAAATTRLELGTTVLVLPYRDPLLVARMTASLDQLSGGRFILGVGSGWSKPEFEALGLEYARRGAMTDEYLAVIRTAWTQEVFSFRGAFKDAANIHAAPLPHRTPTIPIWVGGNSAAAMRRTVRFGDAWHPINPEAGWLRTTGLPRLAELSADEGRATPAIAPRLSLRIADAPIEETGRRAGTGTIDQIRGDLDDVAALGAEYVLLDAYAGDPGQDAASRARRWEALRTLARGLR